MTFKQVWAEFKKLSYSMGFRQKIVGDYAFRRGDKIIRLKGYKNNKIIYVIQANNVPKKR